MPERTCRHTLSLSLLTDVLHDELKSATSFWVGDGYAVLHGGVHDTVKELSQELLSAIKTEPTTFTYSTSRTQLWATKVHRCLSCEALRVEVKRARRTSQGKLPLLAISLLRRPGAGWELSWTVSQSGITVRLADIWGNTSPKRQGLARYVEETGGFEYLTLPNPG